MVRELHGPGALIAMSNKHRIVGSQIEPAPANKDHVKSERTKNL
jgi:hypothetical protein